MWVNSSVRAVSTCHASRWPMKQSAMFSFSDEYYNWSPVDWLSTTGSHVPSSSLLISTQAGFYWLRRSRCPELKKLHQSHCLKLPAEILSFHAHQQPSFTRLCISNTSEKVTAPMILLLHMSFMTHIALVEQKQGMANVLFQACDWTSTKKSYWETVKSYQVNFQWEFI